MARRRRALAVPLALLLLGAAPGPSIAAPEAGLWRTQDRSSVVALGACGSGLCGRLVGLAMDRPDGVPARDIWGGSQCQEIIIRMDRRAEDGRWHGTILDPRSGHTWRAEIWSRESGLRLRGYLGLPLFGATQIWTAYHGALHPNCYLDH